VSGRYRILVIGPSWVGDMMMAQSLFMRLKENNPDCRIDVLAPGWSLPVLAHMPEVSEAIRSPFQHGEAALRQRFRLGKSLRDRHYDQAIILPNSMKSALVPFWGRHSTSYRLCRRDALRPGQRRQETKHRGLTQNCHAIYFVRASCPTDTAQQYTLAAFSNQCARYFCQPQDIKPG